MNQKAPRRKIGKIPNVNFIIIASNKNGSIMKPNGRKIAVGTIKYKTNLGILN